MQNEHVVGVRFFLRNWIWTFLLYQLSQFLGKYLIYMETSTLNSIWADFREHLHLVRPKPVILRSNFFNFHLTLPTNPCESVIYACFFNKNHIPQFRPFLISYNNMIFISLIKFDEKNVYSNKVKYNFFNYK